MWRLAFWKGAGERALRVFAWVLSVTLVGPQAADVVHFNVLHVGWSDAVGFALGATLLSLLASIAGNGVGAGPPGSASLVADRPTDPQNR